MAAESVPNVVDALLGGLNVRASLAVSDSSGVDGLGGSGGGGEADVDMDSVCWMYECPDGTFSDDVSLHTLLSRVDSGELTKNARVFLPSHGYGTLADAPVLSLQLRQVLVSLQRERRRAEADRQRLSRQVEEQQQRLRQVCEQLSTKEQQVQQLKSEHAVLRDRTNTLKEDISGLRLR